MKTQNFSKLRPKQQKALEKMLEGKTRTQIASELGISVETLRAWTNDENFQTCLFQARFEALERATNLLALGSASAVVTLLSALDKSKEITNQQLKAAALILENAHKFAASADLEARIRALEEENSAIREMELAGGADEDD